MANNKKYVVTTYVSKELLNQLNKEAAKHVRSRAGQVEYILVRFFEQQRADKEMTTRFGQLSNIHPQQPDQGEPVNEAAQ